MRSPAKKIEWCPECGGTVREEVVDRYEDKLIGLPGVVLVDSVTVGTCEKCGETYTTIPNLAGLIATAALSRIKLPIKLNGEEIRFMRKALDLPAGELAELLGVRPETISRWENGREPIGPSNEKLLRLLVWIKLRDDAPSFELDGQEIADMRVRSVKGHTRPVPIALRCAAVPKKYRRHGSAVAWDENEVAAATG